MAVSLYRTYRPQTFSEVVGQEHVETTLMNAVNTGKPSHAYLFCGPRGTGKTTTARLLAKALLCEKAPTAEPDGTCTQCREIADGIHPDVYELDAASRTGVDNIREEIISRVKFAPTRGAYKVYIIDEVHMLSVAAFNALLLTLEEPPSHIIFVLCTTDVHKVPATIISRCQRFDFKRLSETQIVDRLAFICEAEGFAVEPGALELIARRSQGGMRDAIGSLEQAAVFGGGTVSFRAVEDLLGEVSLDQLFELSDLIAIRDVAGCFSWVAAFAQGATDIALFVNELAGHIRNLYAFYVVENSSELAGLFNSTEETSDRYQTQARRFGSADRLAYMLGVVGDLTVELKSTTNARLALEIALTRMVRPKSDLTLEELAARVAVLEDITKHGALREEHTTYEAPPKEQKDAAEKNDNQPEEGTPHLGEEGSGLEGGAGTHRLWLQVENEIRKQNKFLGSMLSGTQANIDTNKQQLTITLPSDANFSKMKLEDPVNIGVVSSVIEKIFGTVYQPVYVLGDIEDHTYTRSAYGATSFKGERGGMFLRETVQIKEPLTKEAQGQELLALDEQEPEQEPERKREREQEPECKREREQESEREQEPERKREPEQKPERAQSPELSPEQEQSSIERMLSSSLGSTITFKEV